MTNNVRAKFVCTEAKSTNQGKTETVSLTAVTGEGGEENKSFSEATPTADVKMHISNPDAVGYFQEGQEYYAEFSRATTEAEEEE